MRTRTAILATVALGVIVALLLVAFFYLIGPRLESPTVSALVGVLIGSLAGLLTTMASVLLAVWKTSRENEERLKDRASKHALELTKMDYELRTRSLESGVHDKQQFLAAAKVYRILYKALLLLHEKGEWPKEVEEAGLLNVFELRRREASTESS